MKHISFYIDRLFNQKSGIKLIVLGCISALACGCTKTSSSSTGPPNSSGSLLSTEVIVAKNHLNQTVDSIVYSYTYGANGNLSRMIETTNSMDSIYAASTSLTYNFTYSGNILSGITGSFTQSSSANNVMNSASTQIESTFTSSDGKLTGYVQVTSTSGTPYLPITSTTGDDSAIFTYDAMGNLATYDIYREYPGEPGYLPASKESYSFNGSALTQTVYLFYVSGILEDTTTTHYTYNSSVAASPLYIAFGVPITVPNDISGIDFTTTGLLPNTVTSTYTSTYNAANQPVTTVVNFTETPSNTGDVLTENITYTYQ